MSAVNPPPWPEAAAQGATLQPASTGQPPADGRPPAPTHATDARPPSGWTPGQRPPLPPPPSALQPTPNGATTPARDAADDRAARRHQRQRLASEPAARISLAGATGLFVTLHDISHGGCCIVRKGRMQLAVGETVQIDLWIREIDSKLSLSARVCWTSQQDETSRAGLRFIETTHRLLRRINHFIAHVHSPVEASGPTPRLHTESRTMTPAPLRPTTAEERSRGAAGRARLHRRPHGTSPRPASARELPTLPRPGRLTSLELQRPMRPAHREEVARIAEETGIHIRTLYGWLRTLRLEGEVTPTRPRDPEAWSANDKIAALLEASGLDEQGKAAFCARHGISPEQLERWRQAALQASEKPLLILRAEEELQRLRVHDQREIRRLQKELRRKERSVMISEELLQVVRRLQNLWEPSEDS